MTIGTAFGPGNISGVPIEGGSKLSKFREIQQDLSKIGSALSSNNLSAAQNALTSLRQLVPSQGFPGSGAVLTNPIGTQNPVQSAMTSLQQALSSGNAQAAQAAFTQLQQAMQGTGKHHQNGGGITITSTSEHGSSDTSNGSLGSILSITA